MKEYDNSKFGEWTPHESVEALQAFFESDDARRFREIFSQGSAREELTVFQRDAEHRCLSENEAANRWWVALSELVQSEPDRALALAEPLAQHGLLAEELYENLPQKFEPQALLKAIAYAAGAQDVFTSGISDTESWTEEEILKRLDEVKTQSDWQRDSAEAMEWWQNFERDNQHRPGTVLRLTEELAVRRVTATEFHAAILRSGTENITANLHYLDYLRLKAKEDTDQARRLVSDDSGWWLKPAQGMTKVRGWSDQRIRERYEKAKENLGWDEATEGAKTWWKEFENENAHRPALLLRLAEELGRRNSTIQSFHEAFDLSAVNDVQANLFFLDYMRLKKEEEQKKKAEEEQRQREEAREQRQKERIARASQLFRELLPLFEAEIPAPALAEEGAAILLNLPRLDVPDAVRQRFDLAIGSFGFETVLLNKSGKIKQRRQCQALRLVEELAPGVPLEMVEIPGGKFLMGTNPDDAGKEKEEIARYTEKENAERWVNTELPQREVTVLPFHIGKFAVTQEQWSVVAAWEKVERDLNPDPSNFKGDDRPVEQVSWHDAVEFCARLSKKTGRLYRLPTEAEWEYACRAGTTTPFAFGETITPEFVNYDGEYPYAKAKKGENRGKTIPVGSLGVANAFGLFDMHGNVWEWCEDVWHSNYEGAPNDGSAWLSGGDSTNRVLRGGSWVSLSIDCRSAARILHGPVVRNYNIGFRVVVVARTP